MLCSVHDENHDLDDARLSTARHQLLFGLVVRLHISHKVFDIADTAETFRDRFCNKWHYGGKECMFHAVSRQLLHCISAAMSLPLLN